MDYSPAWSPDGTQIAFASTRGGGQLPYIWVMNANGSHAHALTASSGLDHGAIWSFDGRHIVFTSTRDGDGELWTMNADGSDARQITDFGAMSWAPYFHPSGEYIIFASNKLGFENFELFMVDAQGTKEPVQVTYSPGFDGLPVPSPDGKQLAWTSSRSGGSAGQLFLAQWNHEKALAAIKAAPPRKPSKKS
jgi:Tol biopolymer transport system component